MAVVFGDYRATGLTSRLNLDLSLSQFTKEQLTTPSPGGETILNTSKFKSYCFYMMLAHTWDRPQMQGSGPSVFARWLVPLITMGMHVPLLITCLNWPTEALLMTCNLIPKTWDAPQKVQPVYGARGYGGRRQRRRGAVVEKVTREKHSVTH